MTRVHWGQTPFRVNDDPKVSQLDAEYNLELGQSDPIVILQKADQSLGHFWSGTEYDPQWTNTLLEAVRHFRSVVMPCRFTRTNAHAHQSCIFQSYAKTVPNEINYAWTSIHDNGQGVTACDVWFL